MKTKLQSLMKSFVFFVVLALLLTPAFSAPAPVFAQDVIESADLVQAVTDSALAYFALDASQLTVSDIVSEGDWARGYVVVMTDGDESLNLWVFIGNFDGAVWTVTIEGQPAYDEQLANIPEMLRAPYMVAGQKMAMSSDELGLSPMPSLASSWVNQPELAMPWSTGIAWKLTGGPHNDNGSSTRPWSALDFSPGNSGNWKVRAAADGTARISSACPSTVIIDHANGWQTGYAHLSSVKVKNGQTGITRGMELGTASGLNCKSQNIYDAHTHFTLRRSGVFQEWKNRYVGGFYVRDGSAPYNGYLERVSDKKKINQWAYLPVNAGTVGLGKPGTPALTSPLNTTVNSSTVNFTWKSTYGVIQYQIQIGVDSTFGSVVASATPTATSYSISTLTTGQYYWRVRGENYLSNGDWSATGSFYLDTSGTPPPAPFIVNPVLTPAVGTVCSSAWYKVSGTGYNGTNVYLTLNTQYSSQSTNSGKWTPNIPLSGRYKIEVYIGHHSPVTWSCPTKYISKDSSDARYKIYYSGGSTTKVIDQYPLDNQWATLGEYYFVAGTSGYIKLTDLNGEANLTRTISFNVVRVTWVGP
jgi:murein DD-endopeptidase MepM/ murein hydrolase activator NlpD